MLKLDKAIVAETLAISIIGGLCAILSVRFGIVDMLHSQDVSQGHLHMDFIAGAFFAAALSLPVLMFRWNGRLRLAVVALRTSEAAVHSAARRDTMTGLPNMLGLYDCLTATTAPNGTGADGTGADGMGADCAGAAYLLLIDLNRFKSINDLRGHAAGDAILLQVATRLAARLGPGDRLYRTGGDEFAIVRKAMAPGRPVADFAAELVEGLAQPYQIQDWTEEITGSVGIAAIEPGADTSETIQHADQALHHAKSVAAEGWAVFDDALGIALRGKALMEAELREAIQSNAIVPYFQPILMIETGELIGFEVLARWHRDTSGFVPPDVFIPMAEALGLIDRLSDQLLSKCCIAMTRWDPELMLSFNLSPRQLNQINLARRIDGILSEHGISGRRLAIEITETAVFIDIDRARTVISELRVLGIRVSLDDFGIGTSSLAVLSQLPFDTIKIDRSFISNIRENPQNAKIVRGVLALARSLELTVTAEGIESEEDLAFLRKHKCVLGQGYFFSRPVPEDALPQLIADVRRAAAIIEGGISELAPRLLPLDEDTDNGLRTASN